MELHLCGANAVGWIRGGNGRSRQAVLDARKRPNLRENPEIRTVTRHARGWKIGKAGICIQELRKTVGTEVGPVFFSGDPVEGEQDWDRSALTWR